MKENLEMAAAGRLYWRLWENAQRALYLKYAFNFCLHLFPQTARQQVFFAAQAFTENVRKGSVRPGVVLEDGVIVTLSSIGVMGDSFISE